MAIHHGDDLYGISDSPLKKMIEELSYFYDVSPLWIKGIVTTESQWNTGALRYEPTYSYLFHPEKFTSGWITLPTETTTQKLSWGLGQVMGALAREQGLTGFMSQLLDPGVNLKHLCLRLQFLKKQYSDQDTDVFSMYNGGPGAFLHKKNGVYPNQSYVDRVLQNINLFS